MVRSHFAPREEVSSARFSSSDTPVLVLVMEANGQRDVNVPLCLRGRLGSLLASLQQFLQDRGIEQKRVPKEPGGHVTDWWIYATLSGLAPSSSVVVFGETEHLDVNPVPHLWVRGKKKWIDMGFSLLSAFMKNLMKTESPAAPPPARWLSAVLPGPPPTSSLQPRATQSCAAPPPVRRLSTAVPGPPTSSPEPQVSFLVCDVQWARIVPTGPCSPFFSNEVTGEWREQLLVGASYSEWF